MIEDDRNVRRLIWRFFCLFYRLELTRSIQRIQSRYDALRSSSCEPPAVAIVRKPGPLVLTAQPAGTSAALCTSARSTRGEMPLLWLVNAREYPAVFIPCKRERPGCIAQLNLNTRGILAGLQGVAELGKVLVDGAAEKGEDADVERISCQQRRPMFWMGRCESLSPESCTPLSPLLRLGHGQR